MSLPEPGSTPPPLSLPNHDGISVSLADHAGSNILVWFFSRAFGSN
jgi:peroxiredoxin